MLWQTMREFLDSWFIYPGLKWELMLIGIGLALAFGAVWLVCHWPTLSRTYWLWAAAVFTAFFTMLAVVFVQMPLQYYAGTALEHFWNQFILYDWLLLAGLPGVLLSGLVQEGAKMVPIVFWWWRSGRNIDPKMGLALGAIVGAGFGIFEAVWAHNQVFMSGWTWQIVQSNGVLMLTPFWDRFWVIAFHIAASSLVGYGLAKGRGWQYYLIAAGLHGLINYVVLPFRKGHLTFNQVEIYVAVVAGLVTMAVLWLRWRKEEEGELQEEPKVEPVQPPETIEAEP
jgi:RsiW-degrading membrane proteinase PrsW (M82 family)